MKRTYILLLAALMLAPTASQAQRRKRKAAPAPKPVVVEETPEERLFKTMLPSTAKVLFVDSVVVDRDSFLTAVPLNREAGRVMRLADFLGMHSQPLVETSVYINEFGNEAYYAAGDTTATRLYKADLLGQQWGEPVAVEGIGEEYTHVNFPFLMSDGVTLFFAAKGEKSLGGYDIFTTLFDSDSGKFYQPENYGLPFNSPANEYLLAIDDMDSLGWLVTDRYQPEGKVCVYTFSHEGARVGFEEDMDEATLKGYASLSAVSDTWKFGDRRAAVERRRRMMDRMQKGTDPDVIEFVINERTTYHNINEFRSRQNRQRYLLLNGKRASLQRRQAELAAMRDRYHAASDSGRGAMREALLRAEQQVEQMETAIHEEEKEIRRSELKK